MCQELVSVLDYRRTVHQAQIVFEGRSAYFFCEVQNISVHNLRFYSLSIFCGPFARDPGRADVLLERLEAQVEAAVRCFDPMHSTCMDLWLYKLLVNPGPSQFGFYLVLI